MPRSSRRRSRKHDGYREERDRFDSDEEPRPREQQEKRGSARASKGSEQHEQRLSSAWAKLSDAGDASGSSVEGQKKRKVREEQEAVPGDGLWSGGGRGEDDGSSYYDSKKSKNSDGDAKRKSTRKFEESDRSSEVGRRTSERGALLEEDSAGEHNLMKVGAREHEAEKSKESKQVVVLKEDSMDQQYKMVKDRSREHGVEKTESGFDASSKVLSRNKEVKTRDSEGDRERNKSNGTDGRQFQDELHYGELEKNGRHRKTKDQPDGKDEPQSGSRDRPTMSRDVHTKIDGCYEQQHRDVKFKDEMSRGVEKREGKCKDERSKPEDRHKDNNKYKDDRYNYKEEDRHRDERYKEERSINEDRHRDGKYKEEISKEHNDERYKEKFRDVEKPRNERSDDSSKEKHRDDIYRNHRHQNGRSWDARYSKDNTRDRSLEKHYKEEHNYSESRHNKNRLHDNVGDTPAADNRSSKYRDDSKRKKRSYEESVDDGDLEPRNAEEHHGDATKRRSEVGSFVSSADHRREYVIQEKVDSRRRDYGKKSPTRYSTYPVREQSRHFPKQEESSPKEYRRTSEFQSFESQSKTDVNMNESSLASKDGRSFRSDDRPIHFADRSPSASDRQVLNRSNLRRSHDTTDVLLKKGNARHHDLPLNRQATGNYQSASLGHLPPPPDRFEVDTRRSFEEDNRSHTRERRSSSRSTRSGTVDNARRHGNVWNNPPSRPSPVPNGFGPFQHGPPLAGFHPAMHQFPQSFFGMPPSMDVSHTGVPYPLHEHPESFSHRAQPFPWHNPAEDPYLPRLPGWDANRNVFEEYSHSYDKQELGRNEDLEFQQQPEVPFSAHGTSDKPSLMQFPGFRSEQFNSESSEIKTVDEANAGKTDAQAPKYKSERKPGPSNVEVANSQFCSNYFKRLGISTSLASPELYKKCVTMLGTLDPAGSSKLTMLRRLQNNKYDHGCQAKCSKYMIKSIFSGKKTSIYESAMALYRSSTGSMKSKIPASSAHPDSEEVIKQASDDMVGEGNVIAPQDQALPCTGTCDVGHNNDQPHDGMDLSMPGESGSAKDCSNREDKVGSNTGDKSLCNHGEGHVCNTVEQQSPSNNEGELPHDAKALQHCCCNSEGSLSDVAKEQFSGVISDAAFASSSQACGCRVNLNRIPCSPGST